MRCADFGEAGKPNGRLALEWWRLKRSLRRRWREWRLPAGFERLGTRYGGWWLFVPGVGKNPLLIDCGLGRDISFTAAFLQRFGGHAVGLDPNPAAIAYSLQHRPDGLEVGQEAFWSEAGREIAFHLPRPPDQLPRGADGVSGSVLRSHAYASDTTLAVRTTSLPEVLQQQQRDECDVLKLDIEGAEYEVIEALCASGEVRRARQLLIEFHHHCTDRRVEDTLDAIRRIEESGFRLCYIEDRNAVFLRRDLDHGQ